MFTLLEDMHASIPFCLYSYIQFLGTVMMSGCGILTNGKGTRREYGEYNLDELSVSITKDIRRNCTSIPNQTKHLVT